MTTDHPPEDRVQCGCQSGLVTMADLRELGLTDAAISRRPRQGYSSGSPLGSTGSLDGVPATDLPRTIVDLGAVMAPAAVGRALDEARRRGLSLMGWRFLRFTGRHLHQEPRTVARQIAPALDLDI